MRVNRLAVLAQSHLTCACSAMCEQVRNSIALSEMPRFVPGRLQRPNAQPSQQRRWACALCGAATILLLLAGPVVDVSLSTGNTFLLTVDTDFVTCGDYDDFRTTPDGRFREQHRNYGAENSISKFSVDVLQKRFSSIYILCS